MFQLSVHESPLKNAIGQPILIQNQLNNLFIYLR